MNYFFSNLSENGGIQMKNKTLYYLVTVGIAILSLYIIYDIIFDYLHGKELTLSSLITVPLLIMLFMQLKTWGFDQKAQKDEMGQMITNISAKISYFILIGFLFLFYIADRIIFMRKDELGNLSLFIALCFAIALPPIVEFFVSKKYR